MEQFEGKSKNSAVYVYEGYIYHIDKRLKSIYRCSTRRNTGCRGSVLISENDEVTVCSLHDHPPNDMVIRTLNLKREMYRLCQESVQPIKKIFDDVCERDPEAATHLSYPTIKSTLNRKRTAYKPPVPNSFASLSLELEKYEACKDIYKGSVIAEDGSMALLFSSDELLNALNESAELFVDGTFSVVPRKPNIVQLYTIHIRYMNTGIATVFVLCESRTKILYRAIWEKVIELAPALQNNIRFIMVDYEKAATATLHEFFPVAAIHGCRFHFNQSILRKWRQLGLTNAPKMLISMAMSIPLIPHIRFEEAFAILQRIADNICDDHPAVLQFMSYMRNTWLNIPRKVSVYNCPVRTNNIVESFHNVASKHFGRHTNVWIFMENLKKMIITQQTDFGRARNNLQVRRVHSKINKKRNDIILQRQKDLRQNRISLMEFLKSFHQFNETQQYLIDTTSLTMMHNNNEMDETCANLLSDMPIVNHDEELDENDNRTNVSNNHSTFRRSRQSTRTRLPSENIRLLETESERDYNFRVSETSVPESRGSPTQMTSTLLETESERDHNFRVSETSVPESRGSPIQMTSTLLETESERDHNFRVSESSVPESRGSPTQMTSTQATQGFSPERYLHVPEDDFVFWYEDVTNDSDNSLPYYPIDELSPNSNDHTTARSERPEGTCVICLNSKANQIIIPCGHMCMCAACVDTLTTNAYDKKCPLCKGQMENIIRVIPS